MKALFWALAFVLFTPAGANGDIVGDSSLSCPADIDLDDSAWVLRSIYEMIGAGSDGYDYVIWRRVFAYQPDARKRFQKEFVSACFAETHSFVIDGRQQVVVKRVVSLAGARALLALADGTRVEGSDILIFAAFSNQTDPAYYVLLLRGGVMKAYRKIPVPSIFPASILESEQ